MTKFDETYKKLVEQRLSENIEKRSDGCWVWLGSCSDGQPQVGGTYKGKAWNTKVRPFLFEKLVHKLPKNRMLKRMCETEKCVSPHHCKVVSRRETPYAAISAQRRPTRESDKVRFMKYVEKTEYGCWLWTGGKLGVTSYGQFWMNGRQIGAHRASHILFNGPIPDDHVIMHSCDDRVCVAPAHLSAGTVKDNSQDMRQKGRAPHGTRQPNAKLTEETVAAIKGEYVPGRYGELVRLANKYTVDLSTIHKVVSGQTWKHVDVELGSMPTDDAPHVRPTRGSAHHNSKLDEEKVIAIRKARKEGVPVKVLAEEYGVSLATIATAVDGRLWRHVEYELKPAPVPGTFVRPKGEAHPGAKLDEMKVRAIRTARQNKVPVKELATLYGVGESTVEAVASGRLWSHVPFDTSPDHVSSPERLGSGTTGCKPPGGLFSEVSHGP